MMRLLWLIVVGSWRFPWEKPPTSPRALPEFREYHWEESGLRDECEWAYRVDENDIVRECDGQPSEWCSCGRCRVHCRETCMCETTRPDAPRRLLEDSASPLPPHSSGAYR